MAPRAAGFSKKPEIVKGTFASVSASDVIRAPIPLRALPLDVTQLLLPYRGQGRLTLRIERVPQLARLSAGRNNGDGTWSLAQDDLDGLSYLVPDSLNQPHSLTVRVMTFEGADVSTLKVLDLPISPSAGGRVAAQEPEGARNAADAAQIGRLTAELAEMRTILILCEAQLAETRSEAETARTERLRVETELAAHTTAKTELTRQLAAAAAQAARDLEQARAAWRAEDDRRIAETQSGTEAHFAEERDRWQWESRSALLKAEDRWKAEEAARFAAAQAQWREQSTRQQAEAAARLQAAEAALERRFAQERDLLQRESQAALSNAEARWKAEEAGRLAAAQSQWQGQSARELADAAAQRNAAEAALAEARAQVIAAPVGENAAELARLRSELTARESELTRQRADTEQARLAGKREAEASLSNARAAWKAEEAARLAAAETRWREQSDAALAQAKARCEAAELALAEARSKPIAGRRASDDAYADRLRAELTALQGILAGRDAELAHARAAIEQSRVQPWPDPRLTGWVEGGPEEQSVRRANQRLVRDVIVVVSLVMSLILFYPKMVTFIPDSWRASIADMTGSFGLAASYDPAPAPVAAPAPAPAAAKQETATATRILNVRAAPAAAAAIVTKLPRGAEVSVLERNGSWTRVGISGQAGAAPPLQGWVYSSYLNGRDDAAAAAH